MLKRGPRCMQNFMREARWRSTRRRCPLLEKNSCQTRFRLLERMGRELQRKISHALSSRMSTCLRQQLSSHYYYYSCSLKHLYIYVIILFGRQDDNVRCNKCYHPNPSVLISSRVLKDNDGFIMNLNWVWFIHRWPLTFLRKQSTKKC